MSGALDRGQQLKVSVGGSNGYLCKAQESCVRVCVCRAIVSVFCVYFQGELADLKSKCCGEGVTVEEVSAVVHQELGKVGLTTW